MAAGDTDRDDRSAAKANGPLLYDGPEWDFDLVKRTYDAIHEIGVGEMGLDIYPNQLEVIRSEQMLDAYASIGMPNMYRHWSFGKHFAREESAYRKGARALAYELVINSDPCINYIMEENTMTMQTLVMAHAAMGHNHFFKNNYLFQQWTDATRCSRLSDVREGIRRGVRRETRHRSGRSGARLCARADEPGDQPASGDAQDARDKTSATSSASGVEHAEAELQRDLADAAAVATSDAAQSGRRGREIEREAEILKLPQENLLYFLEKHAPKLEEWQRELIRIVRMLAQYFYPQRQTKVMNEGCATFCHYEIMNRLYERGQVTKGAMLEFMHSHSSVVFQPRFEDRFYSGINPYALGFAMMRDIQRMCTEPTEEDREWFPEIAGNGDPLGTLKTAWAEFRDDSFILQFLSPKVMRDFRFFHIHDKSDVAVHAGGDDPQRTRLPGSAPQACRAIRYQHHRPGHSGGQRRSIRRAAADAAPPRAQRRPARQEDVRPDAAACGAPVGLPGETDGNRPRRRRDAPRARSAADALREGRLAVRLGIRSGLRQWA